MSQSFKVVHDVLGTIFFPLRLVLSASLFFVGAGVLVLNKKLGIMNNFRLFSKMQGLLLYLAGINLRIHNNEGLKTLHKLLNSDNKFIILMNHIHAYDGIIIGSLVENLSTLISKHIADKFPISFYAKIFNYILVERGKKSDTVKKIKSFLENDQGKLLIAPDSCGIIPSGEVMSPFKTGAFVLKYPVLPFLIRYVPSKTTNINWNDNSVISLISSFLMDGHVDVHIKAMEIERYNETKYGNHCDYRDDIYRKMSQELKKMPPQFPPRLENIEMTDISCIRSVVNGFGLIALTAWFFSNYTVFICSLILLISGFMYHSYPTNNTLLFDRMLATGIGIYIIYKYFHLPYTSIIIILLPLYAEIVSIYNNFTDNKFWTKVHVYNVQLPCYIGLFICILGNYYKI